MERPRLQAEATEQGDRVLSIDAFRGLSMLAMIFANDLDMAMIRGVPWWMKHAKFSAPNPDFLTFVDVIAPAFLFIVGASIPLAIGRRLARGDSVWRIGTHILLRTASLLIIGVFMGNMRSSDVLRNSNIVPIGLSHASWSVLLLASFLLVWNDYPRAAGRRRALFFALRMIGIGVLAWLALVYRQRQGDAVHGMKLRWYVVGTIGWSYLTACAAYLLCRGRRTGLVGVYALLIALVIGDRAGAIRSVDILAEINRWVPLGHMIGASASNAVAGLIVGTLFTAGSPAGTPAKRVRWMLAMAGGLFAAGWLLRPLYGLFPPKHPPTWALYCAGLSCTAYALLYGLIDVRGVRRWTAIALPAGRNPLVAYFLSFMLHPLTRVLGIGGLNDYLNEGVVGIARTLGVTIVLGVFVTGAFTRMGVRLRL